MRSDAGQFPWDFHHRAPRIPTIEPLGSDCPNGMSAAFPKPLVPSAMTHAKAFGYLIDSLPPSNGLPILWYAPATLN
jgi:hypothetical protein